MKNKFLDFTIKIIKENTDYNDIKLKEIRYGLESLYLSLTKIVVIFIISIILGIFKELLLLFIFYGLLRMTGFGLHAKTSLQCWILSIMVFISIPLVIKYFSFPRIVLIGLSLLLVIPILIYAPADTEKRPLINKKKRTILKYATTLTSLVYIVLMIILNNDYLTKMLFFSILIETILILPITYKLLNVKYNNYLLYRERR